MFCFVYKHNTKAFIENRQILRNEGRLQRSSSPSGGNRLKNKQISKDVLEKISDLLQMQCETDFECSKVGSNNSCSVAIKEYGLVLEVFEANPPKECKFLTQNGFRFFCDCPINFHINKKVYEDRLKSEKLIQL